MTTNISFFMMHIFKWESCFLLSIIEKKVASFLIKAPDHEKPSFAIEIYMVIIINEHLNISIFIWNLFYNLIILNCLLRILFEIFSSPFFNFLFLRILTPKFHGISQMTTIISFVIWHIFLSDKVALLLWFVTKKKSSSSSSFWQKRKKFNKVFCVLGVKKFSVHEKNK